MSLLIVNENSEGKSRDQSVKIVKCAALLGRSVSRTSFEILHKEKKNKTFGYADWVTECLVFLMNEMSCKQHAVNIN